MMQQMHGNKSISLTFKRRIWIYDDQELPHILDSSLNSLLQLLLFLQANSPNLLKDQYPHDKKIYMLEPKQKNFHDSWSFK